MSEEEQRGKGPVNVDVGAKLEAKFEVSTEIPSESSGRLVDALTDLIRPFTEARGLKADLIRLQREEVAFQIARAAKKRLDDAQLEVRPIPTKALIPILEKGSLEDPDSELIEQWGNLLASASENYDVEVITFAEILSRIGPREANILQEMIKMSDLTKWEKRQDRATAGSGFEVYEKEAIIKPRIISAVEEQDQSVFEHLLNYFPDEYPVLIARVQKGVATERANKVDKIFESSFFEMHAPGFEILETQGLILKRFAGFSWSSDGFDGPSGLNWYELTELGFAFVGRIAVAPKRRG